MKPLYLLVFWACTCVYPLAHAQTTLTAGPSPGTLTLVPFAAPVCFGNGSTSAVACGNTVTFNFTSFQISSCPTSGQMPTPGSVAYGGPGSSASFTNYHTLSYSPSNEHQQLVFSQPIQTFQFSASGPFGGGENFSVQAYNGATLLGNHTFFVPGQGNNNTYYISSPSTNITRIQFTEIVAISADDELFGDFMISGPGCPLPVEMLSAEARVMHDEVVRVDWETRGELALEAYEVQRSADGQNWESLEKVAARNLDGPNFYSLEDASPFPGISYYRIETKGINGDLSFSGAMQVQIAKSADFQVQIHPNPAHQAATIDFQGLPGLKRVEVLTLTGQQVMSMKSEAASLELNLMDLAPALYLVRVQHDGRLITLKLAVE